ncbi:MAG: leucyl/phenylalanyl-tRNA--protein transferase [Bacteriovoracaceae bacterium]|nr:leucyl/phenylalanyl-tRNA--protein transferase [Bacteriovoracaceae bacterium]
MAIIEFPPVDSADENGIVGLGGDLEVQSLILAYTEGIFPWPIGPEIPLAWFSPEQRGVLYTDKFHISASLKKFLNKSPYTIKYNHNFAAVIKECAQVVRKGQKSTWITEDIIQAYINMFQHKLAYSVEAYDKDNELVGGVYGVCIGEIFSGESMFYKKDNASKACLVALLTQLKQKKIKFLDTQMVTPVVKSLGGTEISRQLFIKTIKKSDTKKPREYFLGN